MVRTETIADGVVLHLGDCRDVMASMPPCFRADVVITDPPYGIGFTGKVTKHTDRRAEGAYVDTPENFFGVVLPGVTAAMQRADRAAIFSGITRLGEYPEPTDIGGSVCPNGGGRSSWGFGCYHPILYYGNSPYLAKGLGSRPTAASMYHPGMHVTGERDNDHPCPKPIAFMLWAVETASLRGQTILDPFMGSGTTGVAAIQKGRKFVGIEIEPSYFDIARRRMEIALQQQDLFIEKPKSVQLGLLP
jgi:site-specific DNA-methyltransferase (adenine-specific)